MVNLLESFRPRFTLAEMLTRFNAQIHPCELNPQNSNLTRAQSSKFERFFQRLVVACLAHGDIQPLLLADPVAIPPELKWPL